jgi:hypothetical protein
VDSRNTLTIQESFKRPFPVEVLTMIIAKTDRKMLPACLRVSSQWFHLAGKLLYSNIVIGRGGVTARALLKGADIAFSDQDDRNLEAAKPDFKQQLLKYVQTITINDHACSTHEGTRSALTRGFKCMTGLKQTILCPEASFTRTDPLCGGNSGCPILAGIQCHSVTIQNIRRQGTPGSPLELFTPILDHVKHATLVIQPLASYIGKGGPVDMTRKNGRPQDLAVPTRKLGSVRILVAMSDSEIGSMESALERAANLAKLGPLQDFLAAFISLHPSKIEIYMFNEPSHLGRSQDTLDSLKEQLAFKVDQHYQKSIKKLTDTDKLKEEHSSWSPNYEVFDLKHYFAHSDLPQELDRWMRHDWERDLEWAQNYEKEEKKRAEQKAAAGNANVSGCTLKVMGW